MKLKDITRKVAVDYFKPNMVVECMTDLWEGHINKGQRYVVESVRSAGLYKSWIKLSGIDIGRCPNHFKIIEE